MKNSVIASCIDDCTVEMIRQGTSVVVGVQDKYVYVINPNVKVGDDPLITYVGLGGIDLFNKVIAEICRNSSCDSFFRSNTDCHLKNGYPVSENGETRKRVLYYAKFTLNTYNSAKEKKMELAAKVANAEVDDSLLL